MAASCPSSPLSVSSTAAEDANHKKEKQQPKGEELRVNPCLVTLNVLFGCVGIGFVSVGVWLALNNGTNCVHFLQTFLIWTGILMVGVAAAGIVGAIWRIVWLLYLNFLVMFLLLLLVVGTTVFVLIVTSHGISATLNVDRYPHDAFSDWLRDQVDQRIQSCTQNGQICQFVQQSYDNGYYSRPRLSTLQMACCQAPADCNSYRSDLSPSLDADCGAWREAGASTGFCSRCSSCRAAVAENIRHVWHVVAIFKVIALLILLPAYFVTCCYFKQDDHGDGSFRRSVDCCFNVL